MTFHLRLLHISEVNAGGRERPAAWDWQRAGGDAWLRQLDPLCDDSNVDLVCVTGRAAGRGLDGQSRATGFLAMTLDRLGLGWERLFLVPSANPTAPRPADGRPAEPGCRRELRLAHLPFGIQVISLDAAWLGGGAGARRQWLTTAAVERLASGPLGEPLPGFRLGLLQQRLTELDVVPATARRLAERVDLLLSGDAQAVEVAGAEAWLTAGGAPRQRRRSRQDGQLQAGRLPAGQRRSPRGDGRSPIAFQLITVTCDAAGRPCRVILRLRSAPAAATVRPRAVPCGGSPGLRAVPAARSAAVNDPGDHLGGDDEVDHAAAEPGPRADSVAGAVHKLPAAAAKPSTPAARVFGEGLARDCAQAARLARFADQLLANGSAEQALPIYRDQLLPLYQALAALPPRGLLVRRIAEALAAHGADPRRTT
jgi:hypothetical protein